MGKKSLHAEARKICLVKRSKKSIKKKKKELLTLQHRCAETKILSRLFFKDLVSRSHVSLLK